MYLEIASEIGLLVKADFELFETNIAEMINYLYEETIKSFKSNFNSFQSEVNKQLRNKYILIDDLPLQLKPLSR